MMGRIYDALRSLLDGDQIKYEEYEGRTALRYGFSTEEHRWIVVGDVREKEEVIVILAILSKVVEPPQRVAVAELITRINYRISIGNFEMDFEQGGVRFRTSADLEGSPAEPAILRQLLRANLAT